MARYHRKLQWSGGAPAAEVPIGGAPYARSPFLMVIMARGIARGRVRTFDQHGGANKRLDVVDRGLGLQLVW